MSADDRPSRGSADQQRRMKKYVRRLEENLHGIEKQIKKSSLVELSLDDLGKDRNAFTDLGRLQGAFVKGNEALSRHTKNVKTPAPLGAKYEGSGIKILDEAITRLICRRSEKSTKKSGAASDRSYAVPTFDEFTQTIKTANAQHNLGKSDDELSTMAAKIYDDVVRMLMMKEQQLFYAHAATYGESDELPEAKDPVLAKKFKKSDERKKELIREWNAAMEKIKAAATNEESGEPEPESGDECRESDESENSDVDDADENNSQDFSQDSENKDESEDDADGGAESDDLDLLIKDERDGDASSGDSVVCEDDADEDTDSSAPSTTGAPKPKVPQRGDTFAGFGTSAPKKRSLLAVDRDRAKLPKKEIEVIDLGDDDD